MNPRAPSLTVGACAALACIWEATAAKPGNVYRGADFEDMTYVDFLTSAAVIGADHRRHDRQWRRRDGPRGSRSHARGNRPHQHKSRHAAAGGPAGCRAAAASRFTAGVSRVLKKLTVDDCRLVYAAIRLVQPGGLGRVDAGRRERPERRRRSRCSKL